MRPDGRAAAIRRAAVLLHRWFGLAMAGFLFVAGVTGSVIAFDDEIDAWLNPHLYRVEAGRPALPPTALAAAVERTDPRLRVVSVPLGLGPGEAARIGVRPRIDPETGQTFRIEHSQLFVDPATGARLGGRRAGRCCAREEIVPFLYRLHYSLHLPGRWGIWLMGAVAVLWTIDCFIGAYLTMPRHRPFIRRWRPAWTVKSGAGAFRLNLDLHRVSGLWPWGVLLLLAVSSVYFNLNRELFRPAVELFSPITPTIFERRQPVPAARQQPLLSFDEAAALARAEAARRGWPPPSRVIYSAWDMYMVTLRPSQSTRGSGLGTPTLYFDAGDGRLLEAAVPGEGTPGDFVVALQLPLHSGEIAGLPGRIVVCLTGIAVAALSVTGVVVWWKKRRAQRRGRARRLATD